MYEEDSNFNNENYNISNRYKTVRKRLDSLGYKYPLSVDTLPLVEQLLIDFIQTTESLKHFKLIAQNKIDSSSQQDILIDPYKCDNTRLLKECNQLHSDIIESKQIHLKQTKEFKKKINKLESECNDLQLASSRNLKRIKDLEFESSNKSKRIQELLGKCCKPTISNVGISVKRKNCYPLRKPVFTGEALPGELLKGPSISTSTSLPSISQLNKDTINIVNMADRKIMSLNQEVTKLRGEVSIHEETNHTLQTQLALKEKEVTRLRKLLENGRTYVGTSKESSTYKKTINNNCSCSTDYNEIKILQQAKLNLEQQLRDALDKQHDAMSKAMKLADKNEELEKELRDIDHIALAVEADCNTTVKENNKRVSELQEKIENMSVKINDLKANLLEEKRASQELRAEFEACKMEKRNIQRILDSTVDDKKQLTDKINQFTLIEQTLNGEIDKLSRQNETQKDEIMQLESAVSSLKTQLNGKRQKRPFTPVNNKDIDENTKKLLNEKDELIVNLQKEKDHFRNELDKFKNQQIRELNYQLSEKERRITELQREQRDKYNIDSRTQSSRSRNSCDICVKCRSAGSCICRPTTPTENGGLSKIALTRLERDRDSARLDVERLTEERDVLRERLKIATSTHTSEQRRLKDNLHELELRLAETEREKNDILHSQGSRRSAISGLENDVQEAREELRRTKQELSTQRTQYFQLRTLQDQTDQALGDVQSQLNQSKSELQKAIDKNRCLEQKHLQFDNQIKELKQEINTLRSNMTRLDQEKDELLMELDIKTEKIATLEREISLYEKQGINVEQQIRDLQHKNQLCISTSADQERQLRSMQLEVENNQRQLAAASADRDNAAQENRRLQDDMAAVTCEIKTLQRELEASRIESHDLKRQLQTYVSEVRRAEDLLNRKENERTEMLNHFRSLSLEATVLENNNHSLESEASEARSALQCTKDRLHDIERQSADKDCLIRGYESQIHELTQTVASLELQVRQQCEQKSRTETDLNALRNLAVQLDQQKDNLIKELNEKEVLCARYETEISHLKTEQNMIQDQITRDNAAVCRLEKMLEQSRHECMETQTINQELQNEISRLKERVCELQNRLSSETAELRRYQNQAAEYSKQISELRKQVTNERFDRARKEEEHRRNYSSIGESGNCPDDCGSPPPPMPSLSTNPTVRFDSSNSNPTTSHRYNQTMGIDKLRSMPGQRHHSTLDPKNTNRFTSSSSSSPGDTHKDTQMMEQQLEYIPEMINLPDVHDISLKSISINSCNPLCVKATLQEDEKYKDIKLKIATCVDDKSQKSSGNLKVCNRNICQAFIENSSLLNTLNDNDDNEDNVKKKVNENLKDKKKLKNYNNEKKGVDDYKKCGCGYGKNEKLNKCPNDKTLNYSYKKNDDKYKLSRIYNKSTNDDDDTIGNEITTSIYSDDETIDPLNMTHPDFINMLVNIRDDAKTLDQNLSTMNQMMLNDLVGQNIESDNDERFDKVTYERIERVESITDTNNKPSTSKNNNSSLSKTDDNEIVHEKVKQKSLNCFKSKIKKPQLILRREKSYVNDGTNDKIIHEKSVIDIDDSKRGKLKITSTPKKKLQDDERAHKNIQDKQALKKKSSSQNHTSLDNEPNKKKPRFGGTLLSKNSAKKNDRKMAASVSSKSVDQHSFHDLPEDNEITGFSTTERTLGSYRCAETSGASTSKRQSLFNSKNCQSPCSKIKKNAS
ncbi:hypothetical protein HCN44_009734 [Aphidius gifuensis]|uniref:Centrosomal protein of 135 kDa n=1 Tax=Aphidius gifuensis TaxID=684658 RepID=A0A834Y4B2_APHGI|nr:hypothetical protein HCN44_009734 [Aphidius gifuensis]